MPPCEPLTTTAPAASGPTRVMLSAVRIGASSGNATSRAEAIRTSCRATRVKNKQERGLLRVLVSLPYGKTQGRIFSTAKCLILSAIYALNKHSGRETAGYVASDATLRLMLPAGGLGAGGSLLPINLALPLAPGGTLLQIELAVVIGVDLVEALAIEPVAFRFRHRRQLIVIGLAAL